METKNFSLKLTIKNHIFVFFFLILLCSAISPSSVAAKTILEAEVAKIKKNAMMLKAVERIIRAQGADMYVVALPNRIFFDESYYKFYSKNGQVFPTQDFLGYELGRLCDELELKCLNTFEDLKTKIPDRNSFRTDGHYNERGADSVSRSIFRQAF